MADSPSAKSFDIVSKYRALLSSDSDLSPPIAAIESLIALVASSPVTTISETLALLSSSSAVLCASQPNSIALSAGTDLFQRYLVQSLSRPGAQEASGGDFGHLRQHLLSDARVFVQRAKKARTRIAVDGRPFLHEGSTVLTNGSSRAVRALLLRAAAEDSERRPAEETDGYPFRVIYVPTSASSRPSPSATPSTGAEADTASNFSFALRSHGIPTSVIPYSALATAIPQCDLVLVGAEAVVESGGIISSLGTHQIAVLAQAMGPKPFYVAAESFRFVRLFPLSGSELPFKQNIVHFLPGHHDDDGTDRPQPSISSDVAANEIENVKTPPIDFTPPNLISALITENGVLTPSAISEELVKLWL